MAILKLNVSILIFLLVVLLNYDAIFSYFSQDDFFHLSVIMDKSFLDIPTFFTSKLEGQTFHRPLSREVFNLLIYKIFGLNPLPFHLINLGLIFTTGFLVYLLSQHIFKNLKISIVAAIIYLISSVHNIELYYLASVQTILSTLFVILSLLLYFKNKILVSFICFMGAILCHESTVVYPGILFLAELTVVRKKLKKITPFFILAVIYLTFSLLLIKLPAQTVYKPVFDIKTIINNFGWFVGWNFGLPEILVDFVSPGLRLNPNFIKWYQNYISMVFPLLVFVFISLAISVIIGWKKLKKVPLIFLIGAFAISLSPFLFFPWHKFIYYLEFSSIFFSIALASILCIFWNSNALHKTFLATVIFSLLVIYSETNNLNSFTYWAAKRASAAEVILKDIKKNYPKVPKGAIFYLTNDQNYPKINANWGNSSRQAFYILSGEDALKLLYSDSSITAYFEDNNNLPENVDRVKLTTVDAKFPY